MKLIKNDLYLLLIDEEAKIKIGDIIYLESGETPLTKQGSIAKCEFEGSGDLLCTWRKVIAYHPLTKSAKELDLPLLPNPFKEEPDIFSLMDKETQQYYIKNPEGFSHFISGYKAAQSSSGQFTLEDVKKAINIGISIYKDSLSGQWSSSLKRRKELRDQYIQSLSTQQLPVSFEPEYININSFGSETNGYDSGNFILKTITK